MIEYDATRREKSSGGWKVAVLAVLFLAVAASFVYARFWRGGEGPVVTVLDVRPLAVVPPASPPPAAATNAAPAPNPSTPPPNPKPSVAAQEASEWAATSFGRPAHERMLLERLADAERLGKLAIAVDTIERLRARPTMADLDDRLARRLGALNVKRLFSGEPVPWIVEATVQRGQTVHRIAREHGTTVAAVRQLNQLEPQEEPAPGRKVRVLEFPKATFVVHKQTRHADLTLNGKLFKRYYVSTRKSTKPGAYPITSKAEEGPRSRFAALGIQVTPADMLELDMFLAPGSVLTVSEM